MSPNPRIFSSIARGSLAATGLMFLTSCGFQPIYATEQVAGSEGGTIALNQRVAIRQILAPEDVAPLIEDAVGARLPIDAATTPEYGLFLNVEESAQRLAVQIDASVTRYNYRLDGSYTLLNLAEGTRIFGSVGSVTSYNIVSSQYSTLFAENTAREKAARQLAEELERELLIRLSDNPTAQAIDPGVLDADARIEAEIDLIEEPRSGEIIVAPKVDTRPVTNPSGNQ